MRKKVSDLFYAITGRSPLSLEFKPRWSGSTKRIIPKGTFILLRKFDVLAARTLSLVRDFQNIIQF